MLSPTSRRSFLLQWLSLVAALLGRLCSGSTAKASSSSTVGRLDPARLLGNKAMHRRFPGPHITHYLYDCENRIRSVKYEFAAEAAEVATSATETITKIAEPQNEPVSSGPGAVLVDIQVPW